MKTLSVISLLIFICIQFTGCKKDKDKEDEPQKYTVNGYVQKGPFINGTSITIYELDQSLSQTGKSYNTTIIDDKGSFSLGNIEMTSDYVQLSANGYYFDEVLGGLSSSPLTVYALTDITDNTSINVNLLTHLEKARVEYLLSGGKSFSEAKKQAQKEILAIFNITKPDIQVSEKLDISQAGDDNAILLAVSAIIQGTHSVAEMSELLSHISSDIKEDGILNNTASQSDLINEAALMNKAAVRKNITDRYTYLGINATIPDFEKYIQNFIDSTDYIFTKYIEYPETGLYGENMINLTDTAFSSNDNLSFTAKIPKGNSLKVIYKNLSSDTTCTIGTVMNTNNGWLISDYNEVTKSRVFSSTTGNNQPDVKVSLSISFYTGSGVIEYYENNATNPTRVKNIIWYP